MTREEAIDYLTILGGIEGITANEAMALEIAIEALEQDPSWIPVSERLPNLDVECLVVDEDGEYGVGYYREDAKAWDSPNWGWLERKDKVDNKEAFTEPCGIGKVVAWIPLQKPYEP